MNTEEVCKRRIKIWLNSPAFGGLMEVDLGTSLPSGVSESRCLPYSTTLLRLPGGQTLGWTAEGSSMDQDEGST